MESYTKLRKQNYKSDLRGKYVQFIEHIHDLVRCGEVERLSAPISVYWAITGRCNLKCTHCYASELHQISNAEIDIQVAKKIVDILYTINIAEVVIEGGEPTLYDGFVELIHYIKDKGIPLTLLTNGTCMSESIIECINTYFDDYDVIQISIDGTKKSCDAIRGAGVYEKVINSLKKLKVNIVVNSVVTIETVNYIPDLCSVLYEIPNIRTLHLSPLMQSGKGISHQSPTFERAEKLLSDLKKEYGDWVSGTAISDSVVLSQMNFSVDSLKKIKLGCCAGRSKMYIDEMGRAHSCEFFKDAQGIDLLGKEFDTIWKQNWNEQSKIAQKISLKMRESGGFIPFCPNMEK